MPVNANLEDRDQNIPDVFFPEHLRLSAAAGNWHAYKHAVETVCRLKGVAENLAVIRAYPPDWLEDDVDEERDDWLARDELCKAIVTLNVKDFPAYGVPAGEGVDARTVWARLVEIHRPKRTCWGLTESVRAPTTVEWVLLWLLFVMVLVFGQTLGAIVDQVRSECDSMLKPIPAPQTGYYYRDLLRDYHSY
ncbi:hypothetical protein LXA43DRAFT_1059874 [Ganoderma leucocontextum]|nr:hypothetical protein LXA43DRAFT_1059874 [Ganoderma leucocontextum]